MAYQHISKDPRSTMAIIGQRWPGSVYNLYQRGLTWVTGKPLPEQKPLFTMSPWLHLTTMLVLLLGGSIASGSFWQQGGLWLLLLPLTMGMTLSASRTLWLTDLHAAAHGSFSTSRFANRLVGDSVSLLMMVLPWSAYRRSHTQRHHGPGFCSQQGDDDAAFLHWLGIRGGLPKRALWTHLLLGVLSPRTHVVYLIARLRINLFGSGVARGVAAAAYLAGLAAIGRTIGWGPLAVAWLVPLTGLYQASSILGWAGEHLWFVPKGSHVIAWHHDATHARFLGEPYPAGAGSLARLGWWLRMALIHVPCRCLIIPGDLPAHDWHHRHPTRREWPQAIYARQRAIEAGESFAHEAWGLTGAIDRVFTVLSRQPYLPAFASPQGRPSELMLGM